MDERILILYPIKNVEHVWRMRMYEVSELESAIQKFRWERIVRTTDEEGYHIFVFGGTMMKDGGWSHVCGITLADSDLVVFQRDRLENLVRYPNPECIMDAVLDAYLWIGSLGRTNSHVYKDEKEVS